MCSLALENGPVGSALTCTEGSSHCVVCTGGLSISGYGIAASAEPAFLSCVHYMKIRSLLIIQFALSTVPWMYVRPTGAAWCSYSCFG